MANVYRNQLFGCLSDISTCIYGYFCVECLNADNLARVRKEECTLCHLFCCVPPFWVRQFLKRERQMETNFCNDCLITCFCVHCAVCQDAREIRGL